MNARLHAQPGFRPPARSGFSLIETTISILIVGMMLAASIATIGATARARQIQTAESRGPLLAQFLITEIMQTGYEDPDGNPIFGRESNETDSTRTDHDDVDDYHNWSESPPSYRNGQPLPNSADWHWEAHVSNVQTNNTQTVSLGETGLKRTAVTVTSPAGKETILVALRSENGNYEEPQSVKTTYVSWSGLDLQIGGEDSNRVAAGTNLLDAIPVPP